MKASLSAFALILALLVSSFAQSQTTDGVVALKAGRYNDAMQLLLTPAKSGDASAQRLIGEMYFKGQGVAKDVGQAVIWSRAAADRGDRLAQFTMGYFYEMGIGVKASNNDALDYYKSAALQEYLPAKLKTADLFALVGNDSSAQYWYEQAARAGSVEASDKLAKYAEVTRERRRIAESEEATAAAQAQKERQAKERRIAAEEARENEIARQQNALALANQINQFGQQYADISRRTSNQTQLAMNQVNRVLAQQATERQARADEAQRARDEAAQDRRNREQASAQRIARAEQAERDNQRRADAERAETARAVEQQRQQREAQQQAERDKQERLAKQEQLRQHQAQEKADQLAKEDAKKQTEERAKQDYLMDLVHGIRLAATTCPDGAGHYYAHGVMPKLPQELVQCVDVHYKAVCPGHVVGSTGVAHNFVGMSGCFGDTYPIEPKPSCPAKQVVVSVTNVTRCP